MWGKRKRSAERLSYVVQEVGLEADCFTEGHHSVHIRALAAYRIGVAPAGTAEADRARRTPTEMSPLVRDIFVRNLMAVVQDFAWDDLIRHQRRAVDRTSAAAGPEMSGLWLTIKSFQIKSMDFPEGGEPRIAMLRAMDEVEREARSRADRGGSGRNG